jgi:hypothetical protein
VTLPSDWEPLRACSTLLRVARPLLTLPSVPRRQQYGAEKPHCLGHDYADVMPYDLACLGDFNRTTRWVGPPHHELRTADMFKLLP